MEGLVHLSTQVNIFPKDVLSSPCARSRFEPGMPSFKSHELTTRPPQLLLLEVLSAAVRKHKARDCLNLCPKCSDTYVHLSVQKMFWGYTPDLHFKGDMRQGKKVGLEGWKWKGNKDEGEGKEGKGKEAV
jgi:hypothetical protein